MIARDDAELLLAMDGASRNSGGWDKLLELLCTQMQAGRATLYDADQVLGCSDGSRPARPDCFGALRAGRVYGAEELADRAGPFDPDFSRGDSRVIAAQAPPLWLWLHAGRGAFRATDSARVSSLMPHLAQAVRIGQERSSLAQALDAANALQWRAGLGWIGPDGPDTTAARLLAEGGCPRPSVAPGELRSLCDGLSAYGLPDGRIMLRAARDLPSPDRIAAALGLTLSEARLARALGQGQSLPDASAALGLTRETGRSYAKQIYAKTGVSGQNGLVRLLWCSAVAFG
ncbi:MAG: hypothetical protein GVY34_04545 [Alphaproteobacteria bacterium]|jgi:DNA-binding CsgD family transcriptional regulator|nr:hypothetical protein [Alphaproteobacteria bacterium]